MSVIAYKWMSLLIYQSDSRAFLPLPLFFGFEGSLSKYLPLKASTLNTIIFFAWSSTRDKISSCIKNMEPTNIVLGASTGISTVDAIPNVEVRRRFCFFRY